MVALPISNQSVLRTSMLLDSTLMGAIFALLIPLSLLNAEGKGLEYTKTLPINSRKIIASKTLIATITYSFVPLALVAIALIKPLTSLSSILIPCFTIMSVASASIFETRLFMKTVAKSKINALANDLQKLVVGAALVLAPLLVYSATFLLSFSHSLSLLAMVGVAFLELAFSSYLLKRS